MKRFCRLALGAAALAAVQGCSEEPSLYLSGPAGGAVRLEIDNSAVTVIVGNSVTVAARAEDEVGNATSDAITLSPCDALVTVSGQASTKDWTATASVTGAGLGTSCVVVQAAGLTDTISVTVGPASVKIAGDPIVGYNPADPAANAFTFTVEPYDLAATLLTGTADYRWSSSDTSVFKVDAVAGTIFTRKLGSADLRLVAPGGANAKLPISVAAPAFEGTLSAPSGGQGDLITMTRTGGPELDANTTAWVDFGGTRAFIDGAITASSLRLAVPVTGKPAARADIVLKGVGPDNVDRRAVFQMTSSGTGHKYAPASQACGTAPDFDAAKSPASWVYFSFTDLTAGYGGALPDIWFKAAGGAGGRTVDVRVEWMSPTGGATIADADLFAYVGADCATAVLFGASQDYNPPSPALEEITGVVIPAGETVFVRVVVYDDQGAAYSNARVRVQ